MSQGARRRARLGSPHFSALVIFLSLPCAAQETALRPYHELVPDPTAIALTPGLEGAGFGALLDRIALAGIHVPVAISGAGFAFVDRPGADAALRTEPIITEILRLPAAELGRATAAPESQALLLWWNRGFETPVVPPQDEFARADVEMCAGARDVEEAIAQQSGPGLRCGPGGLGRAHFIQGRSIVNAVFPENPWAPWVPADLVSTLAELTRACRWWSLKSGNTATFVIVNHGAVTTSVDTSAPRLDDEQGYINDCMKTLGHQFPCAFTSVDELNEVERLAHGGHWGWTQFILNADGFVGGGAIAYAYLGGPHTVATRGNGTLTEDELDRVIAHEMGHIYQAWDEYSTDDGRGCTGCGGAAGYLNVPNDNCEACSRQEGRCVMRGGGTYTAAEGAEMETKIDACRFTKGMVGLWDTDRNGIAEVLETYPDTRIETALPDTVDGSLNVPVVGLAWDVPYPAPSRYRDPQTINTVRSVEYSIDGSAWRTGLPVDGYFTSREEPWIVRLPELGGGPHLLRVRGVNSVTYFDRTPAETPFFVRDVKLRRELEAEAVGGAFALTWQVDGLDFGGEYRLHRSEDRGEEIVVATIPSRGGRHDRHRYLDEGVRAGHRYQYRLDVQVADRGRKSLGTAEATSVLPPAAPGSTVAAAPNPSEGEFLFTVSVPRGPRNDRPDSYIPPGAPESDALRGPGDPEDPQNPFTALWRDIAVSVFDVRGRLVRDLGIFRALETERFNVVWDGRDPGGRAVPSGVYFLRVDLGYQSDVMKITVRR